jgi:hypothetical protein
MNRRVSGCLERPGGFRSKIVWLAGLAAVAMMGCQPPLPDVLVDENGNTIRLSSITPVLANDDLSDDQKRQALRDLGITDEELIDALLSGGLGET